MTEIDTAFPAEEQALLAEIEPRSFWFGHRNDVIAAVVRRLPPSGPIFDIGGGNGYVSLGLQNAGFDCVVVEPSQAGAANAELRGVPVIRGTLDCLMPSSIAAAGMFDVLEHLAEDGAALAKVSRALRPRGMLYVAVPAYQALWSNDDVEAGHFRRYTTPGLCRRLSDAGFSVEYATYFFSPLVAPVFLMRTIRRRRTRKSNAEVAGDHRLPRGLVGHCAAKVLRWESRSISRGNSVPLGTSCLAVARKLIT